MKPTPENIIELGLEQGWEIRPGQAARLAEYTQLLFLWAGKINLIGPSAKPHFWEEHLCPCIWLSQMLPRNETVADLGSGAGLPGLVFACLEPQRPIHLFDARRKRVSFLQTAAAELGLDRVTALWQRVGQESGPPGDQKFNLLTARAVGEAQGLLQPAEFLLEPGGRLLVLTGPNAAQSLAEFIATSPHWTLEYQKDRIFYGRKSCVLELMKSD